VYSHDGTIGPNCETKQPGRPVVQKLPLFDHLRSGQAVRVTLTRRGNTWTAQAGSASCSTTGVLPTLFVGVERLNGAAGKFTIRCGGDAVSGTVTSHRLRLRLRG
jgi:hypothetical protein